MKVAPHQQKDFVTLFREGIIFYQQGQLAQAKKALTKALELNPYNFEALHLSGLISAQSNNLEVAAELISLATKINPDHATSHCHLGNVLQELGRFHEAISSYDRAIQIKPDYAEAFYNRGLALQEMKIFRDSVASYDRAIEINPHNATAFNNRGNALKGLQLFHEAIISYDLAIEIKPNYAEAHYNRGNALVELKRLGEAVASFERAIECRPGYAEAYYNRGNALREMKHLEEAVESYGRAIAINPNYAEAYNNGGNVLKELGRFDEELMSYERAIAINPDYSLAYLNKSLSLLLRGELIQGWNLYEWRWKEEKTGPKPRNLNQPLWIGAEELKDKKILLHAEQGLGDSIQFCRYARLVKQKGAQVILEVPKALVSLLDGLEGVDECIETGASLPAFDYHCPLLSLPLAFRTGLPEIPTPGPYLQASANKRREWEDRLGRKSRMRVGLAWSGSPTHNNDRNRSFALKELLPYLPEGCDYVSLQKEVREIDEAVLAGSGIRHYGGALADFADTAALCDLMDVVVSVDTSVAHLAGALGKLTWVLLPYVPDWRWLLEREDSPWYGSVKLYRQDASRAWGPVLARAAEDLRRLQLAAVA